MERLTKYLESGSATRFDCNIECDYCFGGCEKSQGIVDRLATIEDILGDGYDLDRLRELAQADREGRVRIITGPKRGEAVCGNCRNFIRNPGTRTGVCKVQSFYRDKHGKEEPRRGMFSPSQSRKACRKFARADAEAALWRGKE